MSKDMFKKDLYAILDVKKDATAAEITSAYRKLARELHPDKNKAADATEKFQELGQAYAILKDADNRKRYDEQHKSGAKPRAQPRSYADAWQGFPPAQHTRAGAYRNGSAFDEQAYREEQQQRAYQEQAYFNEQQCKASRRAYNEKHHSKGHSSWQHPPSGVPQMPFYNHKATASKLAYEYRPSFTDDVWPWHVYAAEFRRRRGDIRRRQIAAKDAWHVQHERTQTAQTAAAGQNHLVEQMWQELQREEKHVQYIARTTPFGSGQYDRAMQHLHWCRQRFQQENEARSLRDAELEHEKERTADVIAQQMSAADAEVLLDQAEDQAWMAWCEAVADQRACVKRWHEQPYSFFSGKPFWDPYDPPNGCNHVARPKHHQHSHQDCLKGERSMLSQIPKVYCPWCSELLCGWCGRTWEAVRGRYKH